MISPRTGTLVSTLVAGLLSVGGVASSSAQTQTAQVLGAEQITSGGINDTGALTVTVAGRSETVRFAGSSNAASVASGLAAAFALDCGSPVYAHATGSKIVWTPKGATSGNFTVAPAQPVWDGGHFPQSSFQLNVTSTPGTGYTPSLSLDCTPNPVASGGSLSCTAELPAAATGTVSFSADVSSAWSTKTISGGAAISDPLPGLGTGAHTITATYSGDSAFNKTTQSSSVQVLSGPLQAVGVYSYSITLPAGSSGYAANGNILGYTDSVNGQWGLAYDSLNRVANSNSQVAGQGRQYMCWTYDSFGNRTSESSSRNSFDPACNTSNPNYVTAFTFNTKNQIIATSLPSLPQYDPSGGGNLINDGSQQYLYDAENRICAVQKGIMAGVGQMFGYIYDADGNRVAKGTISSWSCDTAANGFQVASTYALDLQGQTVTENAYRNGVSSWVHTDLFANGQLMATYDPNGLHFQIADWLGTRRVQTDALGQIEQTCQSLPFGNGLGCTPVAGAAQDATERHFTGKERDAETNNDYFGARYYGSSMGRWMSPDSINVTEDRMMNPSSTLNKYAYGANSPLKYIDSDGQDVTIFYQSGVPGHIMMMAYDPSMSSAASRSFGPASNYSSGTSGSSATVAGASVPATTKFDFDTFKSADDIRRRFATITIQTSPEVTQQVVQALVSHSGDRSYTTYDYACASSCARILNQIRQFNGLCCNSALLPYAFFNNVYGSYGDGTVGYAAFKPGGSYGSYKPSYNVFDVFYTFTNASSQPPTRNCTINVSPNGTSGDC